MVWTGCLRCKKFKCDFIARTFALIAPVRPDLHRVSCSNKMVSNAPKHYETHQNMSLGSNGGSGAFVAIKSDATSLYELFIFWTSWIRFAPSFVQKQNGPNAPKPLRNAQEHEFGIQWYGSGAFVAKNSDATSLHQLLH